MPRGKHGDAADPEVEGMMPLVDVAQDHNRKGRTETLTLSTWDPNARPSARSMSAVAAAAGFLPAG